jgi:tetratricopeptide (TPR) repeat protein
VGLFLARFLYERMTFGEAAYAAQPVLSWQTTIIGDPLYTPYRQTPQQLHEHLQAIHSPLIEWSHLRAVDLNLVRGASPRVGATYLETLDVTKKSAVLSEKLADLYESLGKPASAIETYEHALNLIPSPEQKVRLRLKLADKFTESNLEQKACEDYLSLLRENPDYPNKLEIYRKMLPLAQKLGNTADVARYSELIRVLTPPPPTNAPPGELKG